MEIVICARYSSKHPHERSIDDQVRLCRERTGEVVEVYADYAISGAYLRSRPETTRLLQVAQHKKFDVLLAEGGG